jgi:hypothetical protein
MYTLEINLQKDFDDTIRNILNSEGYIVDMAIDSQNLRIKYFNYEKRMLPKLSRQVLISNVFLCPPEQQEGWELLKVKLEQGQDLKSHLSKRLTDLDNNDSLLNDWGIYHLHLGEKMETNGSRFIERTGPVLFLFLDKERALCINILAHGSWTNQQMVKVIHENWPDAIKSFRLNVAGLGHIPTDSDVKIFRKSGVNSAIEVEPGVVYSSMGGGLTTAKTGIAVMQRVFQHNKLLVDLEEKVKSQYKRIGAMLRDSHHFSGNILTFKLDISQTPYRVVETNTGVRITP